MRRSVCCLLFVFLMTSCAQVKDAVNPYEEHFLCQARDTNGQCIDTPSAYREARYPTVQDEAMDMGPREVHHSRYQTLADLLLAPETPMLQPPKILRVLLLPYTGEGNELFMTRYVFVEIEAVRWVLTDLGEQ
jgi:conjugal transfer pilus assembly protein TraV